MREATAVTQARLARETEQRAANGGAPEMPGWVASIPPDHSYSLDMYANGDVSVQVVDLTRAEFIALKEHLAGMRGYASGSCAGGGGEILPT